MDWVKVGTAERDGNDFFHFEDRAVSPGNRYAYRLGLGLPGYEELTDETWVQVPGIELALLGASPNPASESFHVAFTLPNSDAARIDVFDVAGRRVASREVGTLGPGFHTVDLGESREIAMGVFWLRLRQGNRALTAKACLLR